MQATLAELAQLVDGHLAGDAAQVIYGAAALSDAQAGDITLVDKAEKSHRLTMSRASAVVAPQSFLPTGMAAIQVDDVHLAFAKIIRYFRPARVRRRGGISPQAVISSTAKLGEDVEIRPLATIALPPQTCAHKVGPRSRHLRIGMTRRG